MKKTKTKIKKNTSCGCNLSISNIILLLLVLIVSIEMIPYFLTVLFPNICYGCSVIGKTHQSLNESIQLSKIAWICYLVLFLYLIFQASQWKNTILKITVILLSLFFIYFPTLPLITFVNIILQWFYDNPPFIHDYHRVFPASVEIEKHADKIIHEFKNFKNKPECIRNTNPAYKIEVNSTPENCWRAIYLKKMGKIQKEEIPFFPITTELLKDEQIHNAIFSILDPGVEIPEHTGYFKGYLRYHLGVIIPDKPDKAYIVCGNEKYIWKEGKGIVFDDMYLHYVKNPTQETRVVLYLDIKRNNTSVLVNIINQFGLWLIEYSIMLNTFLKNQHTQRKINE